MLIAQRRFAPMRAKSISCACMAAWRLLAAPAPLITIFKLYRSGSAIENGDEAAVDVFAFAAALVLLLAFTLVLLFDSGELVQPNAASANTAVANAAKICCVLYTIQSSVRTDEDRGREPGVGTAVGSKPAPR